MKEAIKKSFKPYFWDVNIEKGLDLKKHGAEQIFHVPAL